MRQTILSVHIESLTCVSGKIRIYLSRLLFHWILVACFLTLHSCATFKPGPINETIFRNRGQSKTDGVVKVTTTILSREETREIFGFDLYKESIQPIWLEIENNDDKRV